MAKNLKVYTVSLDGVDKAGKSLLVKYLARMSHFTLNVLDRGPMTNIVWNKIQNRDITYNLDMWKSTLFVRLAVDEEDWKIRCSIANEPEMPLPFKEMDGKYKEQFEWLKDHGFFVMELSTT